MEGGYSLRIALDWRSASKDNYNDFCRRHPSVILTFDQWKNIIYEFNGAFRDYILETGDRIKFPFGFGEFSINKKKRKRILKSANGQEHIGLPIDWKKTREKGKTIYNFNFHTEGYFFGWRWFKTTARFKNVDLWYFRATRLSSRLINHYIQIDKKYQNMYREWEQIKT